jgi:hypothetical protein
MSDHSHFEELAALKASGLLSGEEHLEFRQHASLCVECREANEEFSTLVHFGLPLTVSPVREFVEKAKTRPDSDIRTRFLRRARLEGIAFSPGVEEPARHHGRRVAFLTAAATALATVIIMMTFYETYRRPVSPESIQAQKQADQLKQENSALSANLVRLNDSLAAGQREIQNLRKQLGSVAKTGSVRDDGQAGRDSKQSSSQSAQFLDEARGQEKLLAEARDEVARTNEMRANDEASLVAQQARITDLSNRLRVANATLDMERQLAAAGKDVRELMASRQLHVIDVRDTDPNGNPGKAFGRVFLTEGKSLTFYAFDLNDESIVSTKRNFELWAIPESGKNSPRSLGFLHADAKGQGRWVLKVENPELVKEINSVFVTAESAAGGKQPSGQKMLYAYLGEANHP